jgi:hypothetical protein
MKEVLNIAIDKSSCGFILVIVGKDVSSLVLKSLNLPTFSLTECFMLSGCGNVKPVKLRVT